MNKKKTGISVCMIVKNEESILNKCLESINGIYDELIILDTGSNDNTINIAKKFTDSIYKSKWQNDFSWARNKVQEYANFNYTLSWDADFILKSKNKYSLRKYLLNNLNKFDIFLFMWNAEIVNGIITKKAFRPFLYKSELFIWKYPIHNTLTLKSNNIILKEKYLPKVQVDHLKDPIKKSNRYIQTEKKLYDYLCKNHNDIRMLIFYQSILVFQKKHKESILIFNKIFDHKNFITLEEDNKLIIWEQYLFTLLKLNDFNQFKKSLYKLTKKFNNNRILLFKADYLFLNKEYQEALEIYEYCIQNPIENSSEVGMIDIERHYIHPVVMKTKILDLLNEKNKAFNTIKSIIEKTYREDIKAYYNDLKSRL